MACLFRSIGNKHILYSASHGIMLHSSIFISGMKPLISVCMHPLKLTPIMPLYSQSWLIVPHKYCQCAKCQLAIVVKSILSIAEGTLHAIRITCYVDIIVAKIMIAFWLEISCQLWLKIMIWSEVKFVDEWWTGLDVILDNMLRSLVVFLACSQLILQAHSGNSLPVAAT